MPIDFNGRSAVIEQYILQLKSSLRLAWILAFAVFACGIISAILINSIAPNEAKLIGTICSCIVTLLSALPLKDFFSQKAKISTYEFIKTRYEKLNESPKKAEDLDLEKLEGIFWKLVEGRL